MKKLTYFIIISMASFRSVFASGWPTIDLASLTALIQQGQQAVEFFKEEMQMWSNQLNAGIQGTSSTVDTLNNGFANSIARNEQTNNAIYNKKLAMQMQPTSDACSSFSISDALNDAACSFLSSLSNTGENRVDSLLNNNSNLSTSAASSQNAKEIVDAAKSINQSQLHSKDSENTNDVSPLVLRADILMGSEGDTFDQTNMQATEQFNNILVGPKVTEAPSNRNDNDQLNYVENYLKPNAIRALAANSLDTIRALRLGQDSNPNNPSVMQLLQQFADSHFGTPEGDQWLKQVTNTQDDSSDFMSDSAVIRSIAEMQAYGNYISMMAYQSELRQESLQAAMLTLQNKLVYGG